MKKLYLIAILFTLFSCQKKSVESTVSMDSTSVADSTATAVPYGEIKTEICTFTDYTVGDCVHIGFSCGDFGAAKRDQLDEASRKLWESLSTEDSTGYEIPNPAYVGKKFEIQYNFTTGYECQDPAEKKVASKVQNIVSFKEVK